MNYQNVEQNGEIQSSTAQTESGSEIGKNDLCNEIGTQNNYKPAVKVYDEYASTPVVQIPDTSRDFPIEQYAKNIGAMQTTNSNYCSLPMKNPETVISIANDDAMINTSGSSIIIVNISTGQKNGNNSSGGAEITPSLVDKIKGIEVSPRNSGVKMALLPDKRQTADRMNKDTTEIKTSTAILISNDPSAAATNRLSSISVNTVDQRARTIFPKKSGINDEKNVNSSKINLKDCSEDLLILKDSRKNENILASQFEECQRTISERNLATKLKGNPEQKFRANLEVKQSDKKVDSTSKNNAKLDKISRRLKGSASLSMQSSEFKQNSCSFGYDKEDDSLDKNQSSVSSGHERKSKSEKQMICAVSNSNKVQESLTTEHNRKRVTLMTPSVIETNFETKLGKARIFSDPERQINFSPEQTTVGNNSDNVSFTTTKSAITTPVITNTATGNSTTDITAASRDVTMSTTIEEEKGIPNLQKKYQSKSEMSFEADFTPRNGCMQTNSTYMKTFQKIEIDLDLNTAIRRLPVNSYDPDFKDYDFIQ